MNRKLFAEALIYYRKQEELEEVVVNENKKYLFCDEEGYEYPINNVAIVEPIEYFQCNSEDTNVKCLQDNLVDFIDLKEFNILLKKIDKKLFFTLNEIYIVKSKKERLYCEQHIGRSLLEDTLGQCTYDSNCVIINLFEILKGSKNICISEEHYFKTVIYQFYITLFHELGHISLRENFLGKVYSALNDFITDEMNEEQLVENYAEKMFEDLDMSCDVFKPFNKNYIIKKYNKK